MHQLASCALHIDGMGLESHAAHGSVGFPVGCYEDNLACEPVSPHWHDELEILSVIEGSATFMVGSQRQTLSAGDGVFINAGTVHGVRCVDYGTGLLHAVVFHPRLVTGSTNDVFWREYVGKLVGDVELPAVFLHCATDWHRRCLEAADEAVESFLKADFGYEFRVRDALSRIVCDVCAHRDGMTVSIPSGSLRNARRAKTMLRFVHDHYAERLSIGDIAQSASLSTSECLRCFHETVGTTPMQYVKRYRVRQAARMLASTDDRVADVGVACGFWEASYFIRTFRAVQGCTPAVYRREAQKAR